MPAFAVSKAKDAEKAVKEIVVSASKVVQKSGDEFAYELDELTKVANEASHADRLLKGLLQTASSHAS